jgi:tubulin--tyrosine ligase-like protein 12
VDIPGPLGESAIEILESLPKLSELNGVNASKILETGKHVIDSILQLRLPEWTAEEPLADRIISAMWLYLMTYRLADEEKIDETSVWYAFKD